ncbi:MAG: hypothetical protein O3B42_03455 [Actinomycetota bacterium]|jgi:hypothetical protein|nr:hypothetical protein [Actinomycetota bacterium]
MAVAVQEPITSVDLVTEAVVDVYRSHIEDATEMALAEFIDAPRSVGAVRAIVAPKGRIVEVVLDDDSDPDSLIDVAWVLDNRAWKLNVLVGLERLGEAHTALRGAPLTLQGWWYEDEGVRFAGFERP